MNALLRGFLVVLGCSFLVASAARAADETKPPPPTIAVLMDRVAGLIKKGDYETIERFGLEWRGRNGRVPLCRDGQSKLMALAFVLQRFSPRNQNLSRPLDRLLEKWQAALPDSTIRRLVHAVQASEHAWYAPTPELVRLRWQEALAELDAAEKATGRTADWYFAHIAMTFAGHAMLHSRRLPELPATMRDWVPIAEEGIVKFPMHLQLQFRAASVADHFGYPGRRDAFARRVCELLPELGLAPYARIFWSGEGNFQGNMFAPGNCDWPTFSAGFEAILRTANTPWNLNHYLLFARQAGDKATARKLLATIGDKPDPETFAIEAKYAEVRAWADDTAPRRTPLWRAEGWSPEGLAWSRDGLRVFVGFYGRAVAILDGASGKTLGALDTKSSAGRIGAIAVSPDGRLVAAVRGSEPDRRPGRCTIWDAETGAERAAFDATKGPLRSVAFSPDSRQVLAGGGLFTGPCEVWHWIEGGKAERLAWADSHKHSAPGLAWPRDNSKIVFNCVRGFLSVAQSGREMRYVKQVSVPTPSEIEELSFSPDGAWLAAACRGQSWEKRERAEGCVALFSGQDLQPRADTLAPLTGGILSVDFSPDGRAIAAGGYDGFAYILDAATLEVRAWWNAEEGIIRKVRWSPDGRRLAIATASGSVSAWSAP